MKIIWGKYKLTMIYLSYFFLIALAIFFVVRPTISRIKENSLAIQKKSADNEIFEKRIGKLDQIEKDFNEYNAKKDQVGKLLGEGEEVDFIRNIESLADETGNKVSLEIIEKEGQGEGKSQSSAKKKDSGADNDSEVLGKLAEEDALVFQINLEGDYQSLIKFLNKIENMDYYSTISSIGSKKTTSKENAIQPVRSNIFSFSGESASQSSVIERDILVSQIRLVVYKK